MQIINTCVLTVCGFFDTLSDGANSTVAFGYREGGWP